jgi:type IV secretory pathway VirB4 component
MLGKSSRGTCNGATGKSLGLRERNRRYHMYVIGKTGMGKTTLFLNMILNDIHN